MKFLVATLLLASFPPGTGQGQVPVSEFQPPVALQAEGKVIDVDIGHAAPFVANLGQPGRIFLLVGQFGEGKLRLYPMKKTGAGYQLDKMEWLKTGKDFCSVPSG